MKGVDATLSGLGNKDILSRNLRRYIEKSGKDRRELSEIWGFPYSSVSDWVNGKKYPRIDKIEVMANYFGIQKSDLIEDKEDQPAISEDNGLSDGQRKLIAFVKTVPEDKLDMIYRVMKSIAEGD